MHQANGRGVPVTERTDLFSHRRSLPGKGLSGISESPILREKIETLAPLQHQRGREAAHRAEYWEIVERIEKASEKIEAQLAEMRAMQEGQLRRMPPREGEQGSG
jgi:hypothetical protein